MSILVTERWKERRLSLGRPWSGRRVFDVTGTADELAAKAATGIPQIDTQWPGVPRLLSQGPEVIDRAGLEGWGIECNFTVPAAGTQKDQTSDDPLDQPATLEWDMGIESVPTDVDADGKALMMPNGQKIEGQSIPQQIFGFTITKNFPYYNIDWLFNYSNRVNSDTWNAWPSLSFPAGHAYCKAVRPITKWVYENTPFVTVAWQFQVCAVVDGITDPFQFKIAAAGTEGWYTDVNSHQMAGKLTRGLKVQGVDTYDPVSESILLASDGKPSGIYPYITVADGQTPIAWKSDYSTTYPYAIESGASCTWLRFRKIKTAVFSGIPLP